MDACIGRSRGSTWRNRGRRSPYRILRFRGGSPLQAAWSPPVPARPAKPRSRCPGCGPCATAAKAG